jgi:hypothetical protein
MMYLLRSRQRTFAHELFRIPEPEPLNYTLAQQSIVLPSPTEWSSHVIMEFAALLSHGEFLGHTLSLCFSFPVVFYCAGMSLGA